MLASPLFLIIAVAHASTELGLRVAADGSQFWLDVGGTEWLKSAPTFLHANNESFDSSGSLSLTNFTCNRTGTDPALGAYTLYEWAWETGGSGRASGQVPTRFETSVRAFRDHPTLLFEQHFPAGVPSYGYGSAIDLEMHKTPNWGTPGTGWPSLQPRHGGIDLEFVTFIGDGSAQFGSGLGSPSLAVERGAAVGYFNESGYTLVLSPASSFLASVISPADKSSTDNAQILRCGVQGAAYSIPPGYRTSFILHARSGVGAAFQGWGDQLLQLYAKPRASPNSSVTLQYLGYSTTAAYFYAHRKNETYEETLLAVKDNAVQVGLPYRWMLVDSFWYYENAVPGPNEEGICFGGFGGTTWQWDSKPIAPASNCTANFPTGWKGFAQKLGLPMMLHISEWAGAKRAGKHAAANPYGAPPYAKSRPDEWIVEDSCSIPQSYNMWDRIFADMSVGGGGGLATFKQDHGGGEIVQLEAAQRNLSVMDRWLTLQGEASAKHGVTKMLCGSISSFWVHSVSIKAATHTRAGNDYIPGIKRKADTCENPGDNSYVGRVSNAAIGFSNFINWAVGLRPYKDSFFSAHQDWALANGTCISPGASREGVFFPPYFGLQEKHPELQALVSVLSGGPVAPGDNIGFSNVSLILRTCRADGTLLQADGPAVPPDKMFLKGGRGKGELQWGSTRLATTERTADRSAKAWASASIVGSAPDGPSAAVHLHWTFCLSFAMKAALNLTSSDIGIDVHEHGVAWSRHNLEPFSATIEDTIKDAIGTAASFVRYGPERPLTLPMQPPAKDWGLYTFWRTAPTSCNGTGWTLLGELQKLVSVSKQRIVGVEVGCGMGAAVMAVDIIGTSGEVVELSLLSPAGELQLVQLKVGAHGAARASCACESSGCACTHSTMGLRKGNEIFQG
jgi:hypothetical protein